MLFPSSSDVLKVLSYKEWKDVRQLRDDLTLTHCVSDFFRYYITYPLAIGIHVNQLVAQNQAIMQCFTENAWETYVYRYRRVVQGTKVTSFDGLEKLALVPMRT